MTKEQLEKEARVFATYYESLFQNEFEMFYKAFFKVAELREKRITELEKENAELKEAIQHINLCYEWNDDVHDCEFMHYAMKYGGKLTEATAIIKGLLESCFGPTSKTVNYEIKSRAEQFLREV